MVPILLQKSPRSDCGIEIRNNRIREDGFLNQRCVSAPAIESIFLARRPKIFLLPAKPAVLAIAAGFSFARSHHMLRATLDFAFALAGVPFLIRFAAAACRQAKRYGRIYLSLNHSQRDAAR